jgi:mRNA-degrading endonuclease toxin of MazEF toxin-antitoxin module
MLADHESQRGTEPGKAGPVHIVQTNALKDYRSSIICPITTNVSPEC